MKLGNVYHVYLNNIWPNTSTEPWTVLNLLDEQHVFLFLQLKLETHMLWIELNVEQWHSKWQLTNATFTNHTKYYSDPNVPYYEQHVSLMLQRRPTTYLYLWVAPPTIVSLLVPLMFVLHARHRCIFGKSILLVSGCGVSCLYFPNCLLYCFDIRIMNTLDNLGLIVPKQILMTLVLVSLVFDQSDKTNLVLGIPYGNFQ